MIKKLYNTVLAHKRLFISCSVFLAVTIIYWFSLPQQLFSDPGSTVIYASNGQLLDAQIAADAQWRFPYNDTIPVKFEHCITTFEDEWFWHHPGVNPISFCRAIYVNAKNRKILQGGSTLTMQLIRLSRKGRNRTILEKSIEMVLATRAEIRYSKHKILTLFSANAPFGGNVVGLEAASWRYFGRPAKQLSWAESATLAVLPNSPALIYPGKNHQKLLNKRNRLLNKLYLKKIIDKNTWMLSLLEPLPGKPLALPEYAPHLLLRVSKSSLKEKPVITTIDSDLQHRVNEIVKKHSTKLAFNEIHNAAALIAEVESGKILAYVGNSSSIKKEDHDNDVDIIVAPRSTGSILKPFLYASSLDAGEILPNTLIPDIPVMLAGYSPKNYSKTYDGAVFARQALSRSLNIPAVFLLKDYGVDRFYGQLKKMGITTLTFPAGHYGLSLILGGAEGTLWDVAGVYASFARTVNHFGQNSGLYQPNDFRPLQYIPDEKNKQPQPFQKKGVISAAAAWLTFKALLEVNRPEEESGWEWFLSSKRVAWKTGTSFGFRDGWAIGTTSKYVVAVWVGNADGEGRPGLTGTECAAPILFDIFDLLPNSPWFAQPYDEMEQISVCSNSGYRASDLCTSVDSMWVQTSGLKTRACPFHQLIHLDRNGKYRVTSDCESPSFMQHVPWFILPPVMEWYYKSHNPFYKPLPPIMPGCQTTQEIKQMEFIYPKDDAKIMVPVGIDNKKSRVIFEVAHRKPEITIYWHMDGEYIGSTKGIHQLAIDPPIGNHLMQLVDEEGNELFKKFEVR